MLSRESAKVQNPFSQMNFLKSSVSGRGVNSEKLWMSFSYLNSALSYLSWTTPHWLVRYFNTVYFKGWRILENLFLFNHHLDLFTLVKIWMNLRGRGVIAYYKYKSHTETRTQQFRAQSSPRGPQHKGFLVQKHIGSWQPRNTSNSHHSTTLTQKTYWEWRLPLNRTRGSKGEGVFGTHTVS